MKFINKVLFASTFFLFLSNNANCSQPYIKRINQKEGLFHNWVRCIYQDKVGYMWFGTSANLNRYDGYTCKTYNTGNTSVNAISRKNDDELWICTDQGVYTFNIEKEKLSRFEALEYKPIYCVLRENDGCVWFGSNTGYFKYYTKERRLEHVYISQNPSDLKANYINTIYRDTRGNTWFGTKKGLYVLDITSKKHTTHLLNHQSNSFAINEIYSIKEDTKHRLWIGSLQGGLDCIHDAVITPEEYSITHVVDGGIMDILIDKHNTLWFASGNGLGTFKLETFASDKKPSIFYYKNDINNTQSISENSIYSLFEDSMHDLWAGTMGSGVNLISFRGKQFNVISKVQGAYNTLISNLVNCVYEEEKYLWIGTEIGLDRYDKRTKTYKHFTHNNDNTSSLKSNSIFALKKDSRGKLWVGTWAGGINVYDYKTERFSHFYPNGSKNSLSNENVFCFAEDFNGNMWIGTIGGGLNRNNFNSNTFFHYKFDATKPHGIKTDYINTILVAHDGQVFVSDGHFLEEYNSKIDGFDSYIINDTLLENMPNNNINSIFEDSKHHLWISTFDGLQYFDRNTKTFTTYFKSKTSANNNIVGIEEDAKGNLWLSTNNGIVKFTDGINLPDNPEFQRFTQTDGIAGNECKSRSIYRNNDGIIYVGSSMGLTWFNPDSIMLNPHIPTIAISELKLLSSLPNEHSTYKSLDINPNTIKSITLSYKQSNFVIEFAALNFLNSEKNRYKYMLEGYDNDWIDAGELTSATYTNIQEGEYIFKIIASNNDGVWNLQPKKLVIIITPPWWKTTIFRISCLLLIIGLIYFVFKLRLSFLNKQKKFLEKIVEEKTSELKNSNEELTSQRDEIFNQSSLLKSTNEELKMLSVVVSQTNNAVMILDKKGIVQWLNEGFFEIYDLPTSDANKIINHSIYDFLNHYKFEKTNCNKDSASDVESERQYIISRLKDAFEYGNPVTYENTITTKLGKVIGLKTTMNPIIDENNEINRFVVIETDITEIQEHKYQIEVANKELTDSIVYASRIQSALIPAPEVLKRLFDQCFVMYKPKNVVSGDFFWATKIEETVVFCVADCTGHGVPGGFLTMLGISFLRETVEIGKITKPSEVLDMLRQKIITSLNQKNNFGASKDGMDISLFSLNTMNNVLQYACANSTCVLIRNGSSKVMVLNRDKMPVAIHEDIMPFTNNVIQLNTGDMLYVFSDGYSDQFGGQKNKKFMRSQFYKKLLEIHQKPVKDQKNVLVDTFESWKDYLHENNEQTDDVTVLGIKITG